MAITRVNKLGTGNNTASGLSSLSMTVSATTTAPNRIIVACFWGAADAVTSVTDSKGNSYTQDTTIAAAASAGWGRVFSARGDTPLVSGVDTITVTWATHVNDAMLAAYEYSGIANFAPIDVFHSDAGSSTSPNSGSATTNFANELMFGLIGWGTSGNVSAPSQTQLDTIKGGSHSLETQEQIVSATGSYSVSATLQPNPSWAAVVLGYSDTPNGAVPSVTTAPTLTGSGMVGMQLTCSQGFWSNTPTAYSYQWKRDGSNIATGAHYLVTTADVGHVLSCVVTASNKYGSVSSTASNTVTPSVNKAQTGLGI